MFYKSYMIWVFQFFINCVEIYVFFSVLFVKMIGVVEKCFVVENLYKDDVGNFLFILEFVG